MRRRLIPAPSRRIHLRRGPLVSRPGASVFPSNPSMDGQIRPRLATSSIVASFPTIRKQLSRPLRRLTPRSRAESAGRLYSTCAMRMGVGGEAGSRKGQIRPGRPFLACQTTIAALPASCRGRRRRGKRAEQGKSPRQHLELTAKFAGGRAGAREEDVGEKRERWGRRRGPWAPPPEHSPSLPWPSSSTAVSCWAWHARGLTGSGGELQEQGRGDGAAPPSSCAREK